jgi:CBS domain-containing protein
MRIREIMKRGPWTINETDTLGNAQQLLSQHRIRHLPVISEGKLSGMLSERDLLSARAHADADERWWKIPVHFAMQPAETCTPEDEIEPIAHRMGTSRAGALAVTEDDKLIGVVSVIDVLLANTANQKATAGRTAGEAMIAHPPTLKPEQSLLDAVRVMCDRQLHELPVIDDTGRVVGMLGDDDVRRAVGDPTRFLASGTPSLDVQDVMDTAVTPVRDDRPIAEVAHYFSDSRLGAVPIVDERGALVGVMSYLDTLNALAR